MLCWDASSPPVASRCPTPTDTSYVSASLKKAKALENNDPQTALVYYRRAYEVSKRTHYMKVLFIGTLEGVGVGRYNTTGFQTGLDVRYQHPLGSNFSITAKTGLEVFLVKGKYREYFRYYYGNSEGCRFP